MRTETLDSERIENPYGIFQKVISGCNGKTLTSVQDRVRLCAEESLEVCGDTHPRPMVIDYRIRLIGPLLKPPLYEGVLICSDIEFILAPQL